MKWQSEIQRKGNNGNINNQKTKDKTATLSPNISIITLSVNGLNSPVKRHKVEGQIKKQDKTKYCLQETDISSKDKHGDRVKGWKMILQANGKQKKGSVVLLISDKVGFKIKQVKRDKEGQHIMIKGHSTKKT